jgi:hypothetical protein
MAAAEDRDPVGAFTAYRTDPAFGDSVRAGARTWCADDRDLFGGEPDIETDDDSGVSIPGPKIQSGTGRG